VAIAPRSRSFYSAHVARRLAAARKKAGLTQEQLAEKASVSARYVQRIESGDRLPDLPVLDALRRALGAAWSDLLP